jgi:large subunit ribosomal protein L9
VIRVILREAVRDLGKRGEVIEVSDGFARNHLFPKGLAMRSSAGAEHQAAVMRTARDVKDARDRAAAEDIAKRLAPTIVRLEARASGDGGRLFGSVTEADIAEAVYQQTGFEIERRIIDIEEPIKTTGMHLVPIRLHTDVQIFLQLDVTAQP